ncbi:flavin reductase family protein [Ruania alba]|uniref:NADH-FMN oxidoreductase RutF, flavin reductase (DIM6/NTAB) family n=1 Tax=Ruania alba TaxID=648782 RepID=A0A1H5N6V4_9MICO|nr:flavin reductase family protein [Ruania alba]SEE97273.1 NADH-FMN oxidoreductase RutF, flavin reductase (DIM6/NTAB) family [Ruania alba]
MTDVDVEGFRTAMAHLAAGVSVVALRDRHDLAITANSVVSVSLEPPTVLFCVHEDSRIREGLETTDRWAVSIMSAAGSAAVEWLASPGRPTRGQLDRVPHWRGEHSGAAILDAASAWVECETEWIRDAGSHAVVVGRVLASGTNPQNSGAIVHRLSRMLPLQ